MMRPLIPAPLAMLSAAGPARAKPLGEAGPRPRPPAALHGLFGSELPACRDGARDGRMQVTATLLRFCQPAARPDRPIELPGGAVAIWGDFEGAGESRGELLGLAPAARGLSRPIASDGHWRQSRGDHVRCPAGRR